MTIEVYKIKYKKPEDGQDCWVLHEKAKSRPYPIAQIYNGRYNVWDSADGSGDMDFHVDDDDVWMPLPDEETMRVNEVLENQSRIGTLTIEK